MSDFATPLVFDMEVRDLPPRKDPKGGSPKTPLPISVRRAIAETDESTEVVLSTAEDRESGSHNIGIAGLIISILCTALIGMTIAWWTALTEKGVTRHEMEEYVRAYSPYVMDKNRIEEHQANQDRDIGRIMGADAEFLRRLDRLEGRNPEPPK